MPNTLKIIYVMSLGHSGSTLLDLILSCNSKAVGLGEIRNTFLGAKQSQRKCTCNSEWDLCPVWKGPLAEQRNVGTNISERSYTSLVGAISQTCSSVTHVVDSSKSRLGLQAWKSLKGSEVSIIFLFKDVRSFLASRTARGKNPRKNYKIGWKKHFSRQPEALVLRWYLHNRRVLSFLRKSNLMFLPVSYEQLCFDPERVVKAICEFSGLEYENEMINLNEPNTHVLRGNMMRHDPSRNRSIRYDARWLTMPLRYNISALPVLAFNSYLHSIAKSRLPSY